MVRGAFSSWSNYPRLKRRGAAYCRQPSPEHFGLLMRTQLQRALGDAGGAKRCAATAANATSAADSAWRHLVLVNSWNEWGEQAAIEPSMEDGTALLDAHRAAVVAIAAEVEGTSARTASDRGRPHRGISTSGAGRAFARATYR